MILYSRRRVRVEDPARLLGTNLKSKIMSTTIIQGKIRWCKLAFKQHMMRRRISQNLARGHTSSGLPTAALGISR
jgi:hypothetical protein